jgi:hypothetical protein
MMIRENRPPADEVVVRPQETGLRKVAMGGKVAALK